MRSHIHAPDLAVGMWPGWFAPAQADWPGQSRLAGFPLYDEADVTPVPDRLTAFLDDGEPPVVFTPGSAMIHGRPFFDAAVGACRRAGLRGVLLTRHPEQVPPGLPESVIHVDYAPLSALLPQSAALVFHGGIGTASQALKAGVPTVVMPMAHDQFDNADRLRRLGTSRTLPRRHFKARPLVGVLRALLGDPAAATACREAARRLGEADGCAAAADLLIGVDAARAGG